MYYTEPKLSPKSTITTRSSAAIPFKGSATCRKARLDERRDGELWKENKKLSVRAGGAAQIRAEWKTRLERAMKRSRLSIKYTHTHTLKTPESCAAAAFNKEMRNRAVTHTCEDFLCDKQWSFTAERDGILRFVSRLLNTLKWAPTIVYLDAMKETCID